MKSKLLRIIEYPFNKWRNSIKFIKYSVSSFLCRKFKLKNCYLCPICGYFGRFKSDDSIHGLRINALCLKCYSFERHRLQQLVFNEITKNIDTKQMSMLHLAPEYCLLDKFKSSFKTYINADFDDPLADLVEDLTCLPFRDNTFDFVHASHVLEHILDDRAALSEIRRVLRPGGVAIIPVPIIGKCTIEYGQARPQEYDHVRCPGEDYFERFKDYFSRVQIYTSADFDEKYQTYIYEKRPSDPGERHPDIVPVCYK